MTTLITAAKETTLREKGKVFFLFQHPDEISMQFLVSKGKLV